MRSLPYAGGKFLMMIDPFGGARPRLLRRGKEALLRVNPDQAQAFRSGSPRVDIPMRMTYFKSTVLGGMLSEEWNEGKKGRSNEG
ncbi:MAG: hypothetical protein H6Q41_5784 [Deltaproteobacteria bacterium]|nr:hypothetical protein [Deltaproteobacteria bacterium]